MSTAQHGRWLRSGSGPDTCCLCGKPIVAGEPSQEVRSQFVTPEMDAPVHSQRAHRACAQLLAEGRAAAGGRAATKQEYVKRDGTRYCAAPEAEQLRRAANRLAQISSDAAADGHWRGLAQIPGRLAPLIADLRATAAAIDGGEDA